MHDLALESHVVIPMYVAFDNSSCHRCTFKVVLDGNLFCFFFLPTEKEVEKGSSCQ